MLVIALGAPALTDADEALPEAALVAEPDSKPLLDPWAGPLELRALPVLGSPSSGFGKRRDPIRPRRRRQHNGLDFGAARRTPVFAAAAGVVKLARRKGAYGKLVIIDHGGGWTTRYAHLQRIEVKRGQRVVPGDVVGGVGTTGRSTGPHLHFEVRKDDEPLDPIPLFPPEISQLIQQALHGDREQRAWARAALLNLARLRNNNI